MMLPPVPDEIALHQDVRFPLPHINRRHCPRVEPPETSRACDVRLVNGSRTAKPNEDDYFRTTKTTIQLSIAKFKTQFVLIENSQSGLWF